MSQPADRAQEATTPDAAVFGGRYELLAPISSGARGAVYRALDRENGKEVAIKRLLDVKHAARFEIEAGLLSSLSHPRVVKVIDHAGDEEGLYIVMELVHGTDLGAQLKLRGGPGLPAQEAIEYARQASEALQYVHDQQIVHGDVKPQNMILAENGVVLVDFGVARAIGMKGSGADKYLALPFGIGVALVLDESALLLELEDVYWTEEGVVSVQIVFAAMAMLSALAYLIRMLRRTEGQDAESDWEIAAKAWDDLQMIPGGSEPGIGL